MKKDKDFSNCFFSDLQFKDMVYGILIRSPASNGTIREINFPKEMSEEIIFFGETHIPGKNNIKILDTNINVFSKDSIEYKGQTIGILTGPNLEELYEIQKKINFSYTETQEDYHILNDNVFTDDNILEKRIISVGDSETIYANSPKKFEKKFTTKLVYNNPSEPQGAIISYENNELSIYTATQWPYNLRENISEVLNIDKNKIKIYKTISTDFGTNNLWLNTVIACQIAVASYNLKKTVKLVFTKTEQEEFINKPMIVTTHYRIAVNQDNLISALNASIIINCGNENPFITEILNRLLIASCGIYDSENFHLEAYAIKTMEQSYNANLHWIDAQCSYGIETIVQNIAMQLNMLPHEFKKLNYYNSKNQKSIKPFIISTNTLEKVIDLVHNISDFKRKYTAYTLNAKNTTDTKEILPIKGIGIATSYEGSCLYGSVINPSNFFMEVKMDIDNTVTIYTYTPSNSIKHIWEKIAADILDINIENIKLNSHFTNAKEPTLPETLNDNISIMTQLLIKCCKAIQTQRFRQPLPINVRRSFSPPKKNIWDPENMKGTPFHSNSLGACVAEIEIDPCTYIEKIKGIWVAIDGGKLLDQQQAIFSIKKSIQKVLEIYHKNIILSSDKIVVSFIDSDKPPKQIGEIIYNILPAAISNAISNAFLKTISKIPIQQDTIFKLINNNEGEI